jgi:UDP-N-acetylglucosamine 1-carboxyvinyltransferase
VDKFVVRGGKPLTGELEARGSKNAALPIMAASILSGGECIIENIPRLRDTATMCSMLRKFGATVDEDGNGTATIDGATFKDAFAPYDLVRTMRASFFVLGPLLARFGWAKVSLPGGCAIGARPVNLHIDGLTKMGADVRLVSGYVEAKAQKLRGADINLEFPSVGATENLMMAACLAEGRTVIKNAAREPEVVDLQEFLRAIGARVEGAGTDEVRVEGGNELGAARHPVIPDRMETATLLLAGLITGGKVTVTRAMPQHLDAFLARVGEMGAEVKLAENSISAHSDGKLKACDITSLPYPGFPTDLQPHAMAALSVADGTSTITETIFERRFMQVPELVRMGANIEVESNVAVVRGVTNLKGAKVMAPDLRGGAALALAALAARGETHILRVYHIDRGYDGLEERLAGLGADIERVPE